MENDRLATARDIAKVLSVSEAHLAKVLQRLSRVGLVESTRGPKGGSRLAKPGDEISLLEVYETIEGSFRPSNCLLAARICRGDKCILAGLLKNLNREVMEYLERTKLSDLVDVYEKGPDENEKDQKDNRD